MASWPRTHNELLLRLHGWWSLNTWLMTAPSSHQRNGARSSSNYPLAGHHGHCAKVTQATVTGKTDAICDCQPVPEYVQRETARIQAARKVEIDGSEEG